MFYKQFLINVFLDNKKPPQRVAIKSGDWFTLDVNLAAAINYLANNNQVLVIDVDHFIRVVFIVAR